MKRRLFRVSIVAALAAGVLLGLVGPAGAFSNNFYTAVSSVDYDATAKNHIRGRFVWNRSDSGPDQCDPRAVK